MSISFPKTIAEGQNFCNRTEERKLLGYNAAHHIHTIVVSPRRYGKTSLILKTLEDIEERYAHIDLFLAFDENKAMERFLHGFAKVISQITPPSSKMANTLQTFFKSIRVSLLAGALGFEVSLKATQDHSKTIWEVLESVESLLAKQKKSIVVFVDELQDMIENPLCGEIEAAIRFVAQQSKHMTFIFSGSNRRLLSKIFDDRTRPLFKLCERINLKRIDKAHYEKFLQKAAQQRWQAKLDENAISTISSLTENHSYYINFICSRLWRNDKAPTVNQIEEAWINICEEELSTVAEDLAPLTVNQKRALKYIATLGLLNEPTSKEHALALNLTSRGLSQSILGLENADFIEKTPQGYRVVDPLLKTVLLS